MLKTRSLPSETGVRPWLKGGNPYQEIAALPGCTALPLRRSGDTGGLGGKAMTIGDSATRHMSDERNRPATLEEEIRRLAYQIWEDRGRRAGEALRDWLQAEEE